MIKNILKLLVILLIIVFVGNVTYGICREMSLNDGPSNVSNVEVNSLQDYVEDSVAELIPDEYKGYRVCAELEIDKINLKTYVYDEYDENAMWICPTKYYGPNPNEIGNFCIAAHNYDKENMFNNIIELEEGDYIKLTDNENGENLYMVYDIYKTDPKNTDVLSQNTQNAELTLITCSDYSSKRIIVKAIMIT